MYGYKCEYGDGTVQLQVVKREVFEHPAGLVILENAPVGVCDTCGERYYQASLLHHVEEIRANKRAPTRIEQVPVSVFA